MASPPPAAPTPPCKCCGNATGFVGRVDFNRTCMDRAGTRVFPPSQRLVPYYACINCGFLFTDFTDRWSAADFKREIYNEDYIKTDPPIPGRDDVPPRERPAYQIGLFIAAHLQGSQTENRILDFGSGGDPGPTGLALIDRGFTVHSYEPYRSSSSYVPGTRYDVIIAIEVLEHCHDLNHIVQFMRSHLSRDGLLWIQTMLHPRPTPPNVLDSWYVAPRNGHVSIFTLAALTLLFRRAGINIVDTALGTFGFRKLPAFPNQLFV